MDEDTFNSDIYYIICTNMLNNDIGYTSDHNSVYKERITKIKSNTEAKTPGYNKYQFMLILEEYINDNERIRDRLVNVQFEDNYLEYVSITSLSIPYLRSYDEINNYYKQVKVLMIPNKVNIYATKVKKVKEMIINNTNTNELKELKEPKDPGYTLNQRLEMLKAYMKNPISSLELLKSINPAYHQLTLQMFFNIYSNHILLTWSELGDFDGMNFKEGSTLINKELKNCFDNQLKIPVSIQGRVNVTKEQITSGTIKFKSPSTLLDYNATYMKSRESVVNYDQQVVKARSKVYSEYLSVDQDNNTSMNLTGIISNMQKLISKMEDITSNHLRTINDMYISLFKKLMTCDNLTKNKMTMNVLPIIKQMKLTDIAGNVSKYQYNYYDLKSYVDVVEHSVLNNDINNKNLTRFDVNESDKSNNNQINYSLISNNKYMIANAYTLNDTEMKILKAMNNNVNKNYLMKSILTIDIYSLPIYYASCLYKYDSSASSNRTMDSMNYYWPIAIEKVNTEMCNNFTKIDLNRFDEIYNEAHKEEIESNDVGDLGIQDKEVEEDKEKIIIETVNSAIEDFKNNDMEDEYNDADKYSYDTEDSSYTGNLKLQLSYISEEVPRSAIKRLIDSKMTGKSNKKNKVDKELSNAITNLNNTLIKSSNNEPTILTVTNEKIENNNIIEVTVTKPVNKATPITKSTLEQQQDARLALAHERLNESNNNVVIQNTTKPTFNPSTNVFSNEYRNNARNNINNNNNSNINNNINSNTNTNARRDNTNIRNNNSSYSHDINKSRGVNNVNMSINNNNNRNSINNNNSLYDEDNIFGDEFWAPLYNINRINNDTVNNSSEEFNLYNTPISSSNNQGNYDNPSSMDNFQNVPITETRYTNQNIPNIDPKYISSKKKPVPVNMPRNNQVLDEIPKKTEPKIYKNKARNTQVVSKKTNNDFEKNPAPVNKKKVTKKSTEPKKDLSKSKKDLDNSKKGSSNSKSNRNNK